MLTSEAFDRSVEFVLSWDANGSQTLRHNLGYEPSVTVLDSANRVILVSVSHPSKSTTVITTRAAFSGRVVLS